MRNLPLEKKGTRAPQSFVRIALLVALLASASIAGLQYTSNQHRRIDIALSRVQGLGNELNALAQQTATGFKDVIEVGPQRQQVRRQLKVATEDLEGVATLSPAVRRVHAAFTGFERAEEEENQALQRGSIAEALTIDRGQTDPAWERARHALERAQNVCRRSSAWATGAANAGTILTLILAALVTGRLFRQFEQTRDRLLEAEQTALRRSEERFRALVQNASDGIGILNPEGLVQYVSPSAERLWGHTSEVILGQDAFSFVHPDDLAGARSAFLQVFEKPGANITREIRLRDGDGAWRDCQVITNNLMAEPGVEGILVTYRDITERKAFEAQLAHQAFHDALTGLPNRALFLDRLEHALARAQRHGESVAVLFLDLDNFKIINDSLGHEAGDRLLSVVAERLQRCVRSEDTIARLGGDEFTVLVEDLEDTDEAPLIAERFALALEDPITLRGHEVFTTASIGIARAFGDDRRPDELMRDADTAMYQAKNNGKARAETFDRSMNDRAVERLEMETDLRRALEQGELRVHFQPIVGLQSGVVQEVEALVRWQHPERGLIPPAKFIPLAEETGLIVPLGLWVLREACRQAQGWPVSLPGQNPLLVSVNLSARQIQSESLVEEIAQILAETSLAPTRLKLEITESVMMHDAEATIRRLQALKGLGVRLAVDDFGTGYSSMAYLSRFPIDTLKIDRSFIDRLAPHSEHEAIVRAIVNLAKALSLQVTSEGIETAGQLTQLQAMNCDQGQGFLFARPLTGAALSAMLTTTQIISARDDRLAA